MLGALALVTVKFRLGDVLAEREMSQTELSRRSGVSLVTVNAMTKNRTKQVSLLTLDKICGALDCAPGELLEREPPTPAKRKGRG